jgi:hypothetical protein
MVLFIATFLTACVSSWHDVDLNGLSSAQSQMFYVRSIKIDCGRITDILGRCSKDCQLAILNNIPMADITKILSDSYGVKIAQENKLSLSSYRIEDPQKHVLPATKISMGKLKVAFHIEDLFADDAVDSSNTCFLLQNKTYYTHYIDVDYTVNHKGPLPPLHTGAILWYDIKAVVVIPEQLSITSPSSDYEITLIRHRDEIERFDVDSNYRNLLDKMRNAAVKIPSALERDIKAYQLSSKP